MFHGLKLSKRLRDRAAFAKRLVAFFKHLEIGGSFSLVKFGNQFVDAAVNRNLVRSCVIFQYAGISVIDLYGKRGHGNQAPFQKILLFLSISFSISLRQAELEARFFHDPCLK